MAIIFLLCGLVNCMLMLASTLGVFGFFGLPYHVGTGITGFMSKGIRPYYLFNGIAHAVSGLAMIGLIILFARKKIGILTLLVGLFLNVLWMLYYELLLLN